MKKIIVFLVLFCSILLNFIGAKSNTILLDSKIPSKNLTFKLSYNEISDYIINNSIIIIDEFTLDNTNLRQTENFFITGSGNIKKRKTVRVFFNATNFYRISDNFDSQVQVSAIPNTNSNFPFIIESENLYKIRIRRGFYLNELLFSFFLQWEGNSNLPAGQYQSDIVINYFSS